MTSLVFSPGFGGIAVGGAAVAVGDVFLAQSLSPTHLDPQAVADPCRSRFLMASNGNDDEDGGATRLIDGFHENVRGVLQTWPSEEALKRLRGMKEPGVEALKDIVEDSGESSGVREAAIGALIALEGLKTAMPFASTFYGAFVLHMIEVTPPSMLHMCVDRFDEAGHPLFGYFLGLAQSKKTDPELRSSLVRLMTAVMLLRDVVIEFEDRFGEIPEGRRKDPLSAMSMGFLEETVLEMIRFLRSRSEAGSNVEKKAVAQVLAVIRDALEKERVGS